MQSIALLAVAACLLTLLLTPAVRALSIAAGCVDRPDQRRKLHAGAIPQTGGVAIALSYVAPYALLFLLPAGGGILPGHLAPVLRLLPGVAIVFLTGLADDRFELKPWHKLAGEIAGGLWMWAAGVRLAVPGAPWWSLIATVGWLALCANAFNLIDGVDGLAAGLGLTATLTTLAAGVLHGDTMLALAAAPLAGCLLGFLPYNFSPASIFLGDSGSLSIGFLLGTYAVIWSGTPAAPLGIAAPAMALALPLLEVGLSIARRYVHNRPIFEGDRGHIHHRLLDRGFPPRAVALLLYAAGAAGAGLSLLQNSLRGRFPGGALVVFAAAGLAGIRYLGYAEFRAAGRFLRRRLRPSLGAQVRVEILERALRSAATIPECWRAIEAAGLALGYSRVEASLAGERFSSRGPRFAEAWQMRIHLRGGDYVNISQFAGAGSEPYVLAAFVEVIRGVLPGALSRMTVPEVASFRQVEARALRRACV